MGPGSVYAEFSAQFDNIKFGPRINQLRVPQAAPIKVYRSRFAMTSARDDGVIPVWVVGGFSGPMGFGRDVVYDRTYGVLCFFLFGNRFGLCICVMLFITRIYVFVNK